MERIGGFERFDPGKKQSIRKVQPRGIKPSEE